MMKLNLLTQRLLSEGWTKENHPDFVRDWAYYSDFYGGFEYTAERLHRMVFSTPCGLLVKGSHWSSGHMSYMGVEWMPENDNPAINCPYRKLGCEKNHQLLRHHASGGGLSKMVFCACHEVPVPYCYELSIDKALDERAQRKESLFQEFAKGQQRICRHHCYFDEHNETWTQRYNPLECARSHVGCRYCTILEKELDTRKGNVFYDIKITSRPEERTLFSKEFEVSVHKDKRLLERSVSLDICKAILEVCPDAAQEQVESKFFSELFFAKYHGKYFTAEAVNVRAENRVSRDLMQDLADVQAGYTVTHEADVLAAVKKQKSERRQKALQARVRKAKRLLLEHGLEDMDAAEHHWVQKMIDKGLITDEELSRINQLRQSQQAVEQLTLF
ncbi:hypothetical protein [Anaeromassilibacillus sp. SJQ-5]